MDRTAPSRSESDLRGLTPDLPEGLVHRPAFWSGEEQREALAAIRAAFEAAPFFRPAMPRTGKPFSVRMTNFGPLGWVSDREGGYRYQPRHPVTGDAWPPIPAMVMKVWNAVSGYPHPPEACLVNFYDADAKMGLHQDRDEADLDAPVVSISLGDACRFRVGNVSRGGRTVSFRLESGDVVVLGGPSRLRHHGVDRIYAGSSDLIAGWPEIGGGPGGRLNLTLRRVTKP